jgi:hypothetical protein
MFVDYAGQRPRALHLGGMADAYRPQLQGSAIGARNFDERVGMLSAPNISRATIASPLVASITPRFDFERVSRGPGLLTTPRTRSGLDPTVRQRPLTRATDRERAGS